MLALLLLALAAHCRALGDVSELAVLQGDGVWTDDRYGTCLCNIGDVNGDGIDDLMVGADGDDDGGTDYGAVYVARLLPPTSLTPPPLPRYVYAGGPVLSLLAKISATTAGGLGDLERKAKFGSSCAGIGTTRLRGPHD